MAKPKVNMNALERLKKAEFKPKESEEKIEEIIVVEKKEYEIVAVEKEELEFPEKRFDYDSIEDESMRLELEDYEQRLHRTRNGYHTAVGEILAEANEKYANNRNGIFGVWLEYMGFNRKTAERLINRSKFIATNCRNIEDKDYFESLPLSLTYEVSAPNAAEELIRAVLNKEIKTRKEFIQMKKELADVSKEKIAEKSQISFENIISEMKNFNENYSNMAKNIEQIKTIEDREKLEKVYSKIEKLNRELEILMREMKF